MNIFKKHKKPDVSIHVVKVKKADIEEIIRGVIEDTQKTVDENRDVVVTATVAEFQKACEEELMKNPDRNFILDTMLESFAICVFKSFVKKQKEADK